MALDLVPTGRDVPNEVNVVIEIPMNAEPVKYEVDKASGAIFVDRVLTTPMRYPCNYGYIPHTLAGDGDPADVLVIMPLALVPGSVIRCRVIGMLQMEDEAGEDTKLVAVPISKVFPAYDHVSSVDDLLDLTKDRIQHFFEHYKDLEKGKWVKLQGWADADAARAEIVASGERNNATPGNPNIGVDQPARALACRSSSATSSTAPFRPSMKGLPLRNTTPWAWPRISGVISSSNAR
jgi:inorganic pyrophosphatase